MDTRDETVTGGRMVTRELATWVAGLRYEDLPAPVVEEAGRAFADFLGESLFVGGTKPWGQAIAEFCAEEGGGQPQATIIATGKKKGQHPSPATVLRMLRDHDEKTAAAAVVG